jgi:hypothetical protein
MSTENEKPKGNKPAHEVTDGPLKVAIWKNDGEHGPRYSYTLRRRYKVKGTDEWKDTDSYNEDDALPIAELFREAYDWVKAQRRADAKARREKESEPAAA